MQPMLPPGVAKRASASAGNPDGKWAAAGTSGARVTVTVRVTVRTRVRGGADTVTVTTRSVLAGALEGAFVGAFVGAEVVETCEELVADEACFEPFEPAPVLAVAVVCVFACARVVFVAAIVATAPLLTRGMAVPAVGAGSEPLTTCGTEPAVTCGPAAAEAVVAVRDRPAPPPVLVCDVVAWPPTADRVAVADGAGALPAPQAATTRLAATPQHSPASSLTGIPTRRRRRNLGARGSSSSLGARERICTASGRLCSMSTISAVNEHRVVESVPRLLFIGGEWREGQSATFAVEDPSTGEALTEVADASPEDAMAALDAAVEAGPGWAAVPARERGEILRRAFESVIERAEDLALLMTLEMGKPLKESRAEIIYGAEFLRWFSEEAVRIEGSYAVSPNGQGRVLTMRQPVGPCLLITPWNFPLAMGTRKIAPAIAAGCTMVVKPAQQTPLSMLALAQILDEAGLPGGVLNLVTASSSGSTMEPLIRDRRLRKLSFTGSTEVGRKLMQQSSDGLLRLSMELGGNAPFLVFEDADLDAAVTGAVIAKMRNIGEACTAANRFHVAAPVANEFAARLARRLGAMKVGRGTEDGVEVGPLIDATQRDKVAELVDDATGRGARPLTGGAAVDGPGYFYEATVLADVPDDARLLGEEIFGPVAPIRSFESEDDAIAAANATEYGLVAYVFTRDLKRALRVVERLETGMVGLNQGMVSNAAAPFGGVKASGFGREGGHEGINEYLEVKYVAVNMD
jgi:succinate-semialdehyde dehydrogenase/glutarate-semialdehyde dehydrogenase